VQGAQFLERQFSFEMISSAISNPKIPLVFKRAFIELTKTLYIQRYPHIVQPYPNCVRTQCDFDSFQDLEGALNSGRIDRDQFQSQGVADTSAMQTEITFLDHNKESHTMPYRDYLREFHPEAVYSDLDKYKDLQGMIFSHFVVLRKSSRSSRQREASGNSAVEALRFECTCLDMIASLFSRGFCSSRKRLAECLKISFLVIQSINKQVAASKSNKSSPLSAKRKLVKSNIYSALATAGAGAGAGDSSSDEGEDEEEEEEGEGDYSDGEEYKENDGNNIKINVTNNVDKDVPLSDANMIKAKLDKTNVILKEENAFYSVEKASQHSTLDDTDAPAGDDGDGASYAALGIMVGRLCKQHDTQHPPQHIDETVFENQRWSGVKYLPNTVLHPLGPYSSQNPVFTQVFKAQYPIDRNAMDPAGLIDPTLWMWTGAWSIQVVQTIASKGQQDKSTRALDEEGWFYAFDWPAEFHPEPKNFYSYVRKRKWERTMREFTALEFFERAIAEGFSKEALQDACVSPGCISATGKIDFSSILSTLAAPTKNCMEFESDTLLTCADDSLRKAAEVAVNDKIKSADSQQLWLETLTKSCRIVNISYDVVLNARMTVFFKHFFDSPPPLHKNASVCSSASASGDKEPLWHLKRTSKNCVAPTLSPRGVVMFRALFTDLSCTKLIFDGNEDEDAGQTYISHIIKLVMENHHDLCGSALTVLRRELSEWTSTMLPILLR
jgi:hypothetical protein